MATSKILYNNPFRFKRVITADQDLNNYYLYKDSGLYYITNSTPANIPTLPSGSNATYGMLIIPMTSGTTTQIYISGAYIYYRNYGGSPVHWSEWRHFLTQENFYTYFPLQSYNTSIGTLNSNIVDTTSTDPGNFYFRKMGRLVILNGQIRIKANVNSSAGTLLFSFKAEYAKLKPTYLSRVIWMNSGATAIRYGGVSTDENGGIYMNNPVFTSSQYLFMSQCTYFTAS